MFTPSSRNMASISSLPAESALTQRLAASFSFFFSALFAKKDSFTNCEYVLTALIVISFLVIYPWASVSLVYWPAARVSKKSLRPIVRVKKIWLYLPMQTNKELEKELRSEWRTHQVSAHPEDAMSFIEYAHGIGRFKGHIVTVSESDFGYNIEFTKPD